MPRGSLATGTAALRCWTSLALAGPVATARWLGVDAPPPVPVPAGDKRFADPAWTANPAFFAVRQAHLAASRLVADVLAAGAGDPVDDAKAALAAGFLLDAAAPTNFLATNPAALKRAFETGGASVVAGAGHMVDDLVNNGGRPRQASPDTWRAAASKHKGSWWEDWTAWSDARAGAHVKPPPLGSKRHPALGDAPGEYVRG